MAVTNIEIVLSLKDTASNALKGFGAQLNQVAKQAQGASTTFKNNLANGIKSFASGIQSAGLVVTGFLASLALLARNLINVGSNFEQANIAFSTMLGSSEKAGKLLKQISEFARTTPFELPQVVEGAKRLLAYNVAAEDIIPTFKTLGDVAAGLGVDKLDPLITAFGQVKAKGRLMGQELLQLREAGFNLADAMGITNEKLEELVADKAIKFEDVAAAFSKVTGEGGKFFNLMEKQSKTVGGRMSNLADNFTRVKLAFLGITDAGEVIEGGIFDRLSTFLEKFLLKLDEAMPKIQEFFGWVSKNELVLKAVGGAILGLVVLALVALTAALIPVIKIIAIFAAAGALIAVAWQPVSEFLIQVKDRVIEFWGALQAFVADAQTKFEEFKNKVSETKDNVVNFFIALKDGVVGAFTELRDRISSIMNMSLEDWAYFLGLMVGRFIKWASEIDDKLRIFGLELLAKFYEFTANVAQAWQDWLKRTWEALKLFGSNSLATIVAWGTSLLNAIKTAIGAIFLMIKTGVETDWVEVFKRAGTAIKDAIVSAFTNMAKEATDIVSGVIKWVDDLIKKFGKAIESFKKGKEAGVKGFQTGGIVPGPIGAPQLAVVHGGEEVLPNGVSGRGGSGSGGLAIHLHVGTFLGTNTELRNFARQLYGQLALVAQAQNKTVAELMGA